MKALNNVPELGEDVRMYAAICQNESPFILIVEVIVSVDETPNRQASGILHGSTNPIQAEQLSVIAEEDVEVVFLCDVAGPMRDFVFVFGTEAVVEGVVVVAVVRAGHVSLPVLETKTLICG